MRLQDFDFELPDDRIARHPLDARDRSRLLVLDRTTGATEHRTFADLPGLLEPGDLVVLNDTRVFPARLRARKAASGGRVEILLVEPEKGSATRWRAMVNASKTVRAGAELTLEEGGPARVVAEEGDGFVLLEFPEPALDLARRAGEIPLPPYLGRSAEASDRERYQTVYAREGAEGSVAAPTAGLHFTEAVFAALEARGIARASITLHVGPGTFLPVRVENVEEHRMWPERYEVPVATAEAIRATRARGGRVIAVGTTVTRVLESLGHDIRPATGSTDLFIRPGHEFRAIDGLVTNFHLPRSTLLMLVAAFAGEARTLATYRDAVARGYRFYSYGDAMLIL